MLDQQIKQAAKILGKDWRQIQHIRLVDDTISKEIALKAEKEAMKAKALEAPKEPAPSFMKGK